MSYPKSKKISTAQNATDGRAVLRSERAVAAPIRKRIIRIRISTNRPVGDRTGTTRAISSNGKTPNVDLAAPIAINTILTHEISVAFNPNTLEFTPVRDDEIYDNVPYVIDSFGNIAMNAKPDGKIECQIALTLRTNAIT